MPMRITACALAAALPLSFAAFRALDATTAAPRFQTADPVHAAAPPQATPAEPALRLVVTPTGNEARYRVREQLAGFDFPNDALGATQAISGSIALDAQGNVIPGESRIVIEVADLTSDRDRRDNFIRRRTLETEQHPAVTLVPTRITGVTLPLPTSGEQTLELHGDLTVKDVTRPTVWQLQVRYAPGAVAGTAQTRFTFDDVQLEKPRVASVLSVDDHITLEYDFVMQVQ
jgi:polyisoprenoid-binding protein YceI